MSARAFFEWLFGSRKQAESGWQRYPSQETGGYHVPDIIGGIAGGQPWQGATRSWTSTYIQHTGRLTPIPVTPRETGTARAVSAREVARLRKISLQPTDRTLNHTPEADWLRAHVPGLPVLRQQHAGNCSPAATSPTQRSPKRDRYQLGRPEVPDLPTVKNSDGLILDALEHLPPAPDGMATVAAEDAWLNDVLPLHLDAREQQTSALEQLTILAQESDEDTVEVPAYMRQKHTKESE